MATNGTHGGEFVPTGPTHDLGYEPDKFAVKTILAVPVAVVVSGVLAYVTTSIIFNYVFDPALRPPAEIPAAGELQAAPLNERLARISSTDPNAPVVNPRLEGLFQTKDSYKDGNPENKDPANVITSEITPAQPLKDGNSPRYRAQDLLPDKVPALTAGGDGKLPLDQAMAELVNNQLLKVRAGSVPLDVHAGWDRPKESNGGRDTRAGELVPPAPARKDGEPKKDADPKAAEPKKDGEPKVE